MLRIDDMTVWAEAALDTPFRVSAVRSKEEAERTPGLHVKSFERDAGSFWPKFHGILVKYADSASPFCIVRSIGSLVSPAGTVWTGDVYEYHTMWEAD